MVMVFHVLNHWPSFPKQGWPLFFTYGWAGVDLFFVISGFVITLSALGSYEREGAGFKRTFLQRRLARIVPLYLLTGLIYLVFVNPYMIEHVDTTTLLARIFGHALFLQNLHPLTHGALNSPSWSTAVEMQFYLLMLAATPLLLRVRTGLFLGLSFVLAMLYRYAVVLALVPGQSDSMLQFIYMTQLPGVWEEFAMGIALALVVRSPGGMIRSWLRPQWRNCLAWGVAAVLMFTIGIQSAGSNIYWHSTWMLLVWRPLLGMGFAAVVCCAITLPHAAHPLWKPLRYWGDINYGLYLWHFLVITAMTGMAASLEGGRLLVHVFIWTTLLSVASWHLIEQPNIARFKTA